MVLHRPTYRVVHPIITLMTVINNLQPLPGKNSACNLVLVIDVK